MCTEVNCTLFSEAFGYGFITGRIANLKNTQIYAQVSIRHLKQNRLVTHPAQTRKKDGEAKRGHAACEYLLFALAAEQDEDEENAQ